MIIKKTKIIGLLTLVLFSTSCAGVVFAWEYIHREGENLGSEITAVSNYLAREATYEDVSRLVADTQVNREELISYILTEEKTINFLADVEQIALDQGIELTTDTLKVEEGTGLFDTLTVAFSVLGPEVYVLQMLQILETLPYYSSVVQMNLNKEMGLNGLSVIEGTVTLEVNLLQYDR
ncbi:MAG: hypothetical protein ACI9H6_000581 [Patiriisocius sp.]|jgi:hypothetical protein